MCKCLFETLLSKLSGLLAGVELLDHIIVLFLTLKELPSLFPQWPCHFTFPSAAQEGSSLSMFSPLLAPFCLATVLMCVEGHLLVVATGLSLVISDVEHLFRRLLVICVSPLEKWYSNSLPSLPVF